MNASGEALGAGRLDLVLLFCVVVLWLFVFFRWFLVVCKTFLRGFLTKPWALLNKVPLCLAPQ